MADYINRESLKQQFRLRLDWLKKDIHDEYSGALFDGCETDIELIDEIPSADVEPVLHGRWVNNNDDYPECNQCGYMPQYDPQIDDIFYSPYCPVCGSKMDLEG